MITGEKMSDDIRTDDAYRLMQIFMGHTGYTYETYAHLDSGELSCTCPGFIARKICKHCAYIANVQDQEGVFTMRHSAEDPDEILKAFEHGSTFRAWMLENSEVAYI
jgi:uncharacterized Zn finger protein